MTDISSTQVAAPESVVNNVTDSSVDEEDIENSDILTDDDHQLDPSISSFRGLSLIPKIDEVFAVDHKIELPQDCKYQNQRLLSSDATIARQFLLTRHDLLGSIRENLHQNEDSGFQLKSSNRLMHVLVSELGEMDISFTCMPAASDNMHTMTCLDQLNFLEERSVFSLDSLIYLFDKNDNTQPKYLAIVSSIVSVAQCGTELRVGLTILEGDVNDVLCELWKPMNQRIKFGVVLASSNYFSYRPILRRLQKMESVPFADELVHNMPCQTAPKYMRGYLFQEANAEAKKVVSSESSRDVQPYLNSSQQKAFIFAMQKQVALIQGPPGVRIT